MVQQNIGVVEAASSSLVTQTKKALKTLRFSMLFYFLLLYTNFFAFLLAVILAVVLDEGAVNNAVYGADLLHKEGIIILTEHLNSHFGFILTQGF